MSITRINTNFESLFSQNNIRQLEISMNRAMQRISSGKRINSAGDDPIGVAQLSSANAQLSGIRVAQRNIEETYSAIQSADGALAQIESALIDCQDLCIRAGNDATLTAAQISAISTEYLALTSAIDDIQAGAQWGEKDLLDGDFSDLAIQYGPNAADALAAQNPLGVTTAFTYAITAGAAGAAFTTSANALVELAKVTTALTAISAARSSAGRFMRQMDTYLNTQLNAEVNTASQVSTIGDADLAMEITNLARDQILAQSSTAILGQANMAGQMMLQLLG